MRDFHPDALPPGERFEGWCDFLDRTVMPVRIEPAGEHAFKVGIEAHIISGLPLVQLTGIGCNAHRGNAEISRTAEHFYIVSMHLGGEAVLSTERGEQRLERGDVFIIDTMHRLKFGLERPYNHLLVKLPKECVESRLRRPDLLCGSVISHSNPVARLYAGYALAGFQMGDQLPPSVAEMFSQHLLDLVTEALADNDRENVGSAAARHAAKFFQACRLMTLRFSDVDLTPERIARSIGVSTRVLHRLFADQGETVMSFLLKARLARAAKLLGSRDASRRSVTEIAFACGFNDLTHFGRVFAQREGAPPSVWRRRVLDAT